MRARFPAFTQLVPEDLSRYSFRRGLIPLVFEVLSAAPLPAGGGRGGSAF